MSLVHLPKKYGLKVAVAVLLPSDTVTVYVCLLTWRDEMLRHEPSGVKSI